MTPVTPPRQRTLRLQRCALIEKHVTKFAEAQAMPFDMYQFSPTKIRSISKDKAEWTYRQVMQEAGEFGIWIAKFPIFGVPNNLQKVFRVE